MRDSFTKHPERAKDRENEPVNLPELGECPEGSSDFVRSGWEELVKYAPPGVLTAADATAVKIAAELIGRFNAGTLDDKGRGHLITLLGKFGMTPADRSKVAVVKRDPAAGKREKYLA